ncbi:MAG TPA: hypothetical protein ENI34_06195 [candidate division WOR-3 bacterium]|uniref:TRAM domain-containing protein n=1 Tax=candidate division WOR-3 bacterium TaxID=2052148 RepID=A0A9C9K087_UNCW3|nr:hypothetical protein [candidate division WOR-3 bacterium]
MIFFKRENRFVLDSSSIIDGRVIHLFERNFYEGKIIIPTLVRTIVRKFIGTKGERAINILKRNARVEFVKEEGNGLVEEVCVLKLARKRRAKLFTVSDEVCRQSKYFPQVSIIDIRDLYRVLTPIFTPDKLITVRILKRGLNHNEGVGYIEGVKIIVENGAKFVNQTVTARVNTMLAFETGNLVFCSLADTKDNKSLVLTKMKQKKG